MNKIEYILTEWFSGIINTYNWLTIKYEYNVERNLFLVSFSPKKEIDRHEELCTKILEFEDKINALYGDEAPLFCDDEEYFHLSTHAKIMGYKPVAYNETIVYSTTKVNWVSSEDYPMEISNENHYSLAA
jgi:hypothetical protein